MLPQTTPHRGDGSQNLPLIVKKNGQEFIDTLTFDDGRTGWKSVTRVAELNKHLQKWLDKNEPQKKRRKRFGSY